MNFTEFYQAGGPFMNLISLMAVLMLGVTAVKVFQLSTRKALDMKRLDLILLAGSVAVAVGILSQIVGIVQALEAIRAAADVSPKIIMGGAIVSLYAPIYGFSVFIISMIFYFVLKEIIKSRMPGSN